MMNGLYRFAIQARNEQEELFGKSMKKYGRDVSENMYKWKKIEKGRGNLKIVRKKPKNIRIHQENSPRCISLNYLSVLTPFRWA